MEPGTDIAAEEKEQLTTFVKFLKSKGIKLICLDFDLTTCSVWTGGKNVDLDKIRPVFILLYQLASQNGIQVAITTFHPLQYQVRDAVAKAFGVGVHKIYVGNQMNSELLSPTYWLDGKGPMIKKVWELSFRGSRVNYKHCFLIDDDENNIKKAGELNCPSLYFKPDSPNLNDFLSSIAPSNHQTLNSFIHKPQKLELNLPKHLVSTCGKQRVSSCVLY